MKSLRRLIAVPMAAVWLVATRGICEGQNESELATASQKPVANIFSFPLQFNDCSGGGLGLDVFRLLNVQSVMPLPLDEQWLLVSRTSSYLTAKR